MINLNNTDNVVISTRIRLARNLSSYPFPSRLRESGKQEVLALASKAMEKANGINQVDLVALSEAEAVSLVEHHLISPEFLNRSKGRGLFLSDDMKVSIMVNEEDHIRIQVIDDGLNPESSYERADALDTQLNQTLCFAFDDKLGFLTECPTNLGTGMRASLMLHLPALTLNRVIGRISENLSKLGLTIRGLFGEGSEPYGSIYQLSNQVTLGISEAAAIENLKSIAMQIIEQELAARSTLLEKPEIADNVYRCLGLLKSARLMAHNEAIILLSSVCMGSELIKHPVTELKAVYKIMCEIQPATLMKTAGKSMTSQELEEYRATVLRTIFNDIPIN